MGLALRCEEERRRGRKVCSGVRKAVRVLERFPANYYIVWISGTCGGLTFQTQPAY